MNERLALGTVQFGLEYGIANHAGRVAPQEVEKILSEAWGSGIHTLDTAIAYGDSERVLGGVGVGQWQIVSKIPALPEDEKNVHDWVHAQVRGSLVHLGVPQLHAVLLHRPDQLFEPRGRELLESLLSMKAAGFAGKVGVSVYGPQELDRIFDSMHFDIVQAPLNILDQRLIESGWASRLKSMGVELHVRSVFLQGLLLMSPQVRPAKFARWQAIWREWDDWLGVQGVSALEACLRFVLSVQEADKIVIGVDRADQLRQIIAAAQGELSTLPRWLQVIDPDLINPVRWSQL